MGHPGDTHGYDYGMTRAVVVGNGGGGEINHCSGPRRASRPGVVFGRSIQWAPGWERAAEDIVVERIRTVMARDRWIIDGWGPSQCLEERMELSDTLIFVDLPLWMHFWLAAERQISIARGQTRSDPVEGCDDLAITRRLFETIWHVDQNLKPQLAELVDRYA